MGLNLSKYQKGYFTSLYSLTDFLVHDWIRTNMKRFFYLNFLTQSGVIIFSQHLQVAEMCTLRICLCKIDSFSSNLNSVSSQLDIVWTIIYLFLAAQSVIEESVRIMGHTVFYVALDWVLKIFFPLCASVIGKWRKTLSYCMETSGVMTDDILCSANLLYCPCTVNWVKKFTTRFNFCFISHTIWIKFVSFCLWKFCWLFLHKTSAGQINGPYDIISVALLCVSFILLQSSCLSSCQ